MKFRAIISLLDRRIIPFLVVIFFLSAGTAKANSTIYYTQSYFPYQVMSADLSTPDTPKVIYSSGLGSPYAVAVDATNSRIYFSDPNSSVATIFSGPLDGKSADYTPFISNVSAEGIAVDPDHGYIYYAQPSSGNVVRANLSNGSGQQTIYTSPGAPRAISVDPIGGYLYIADYNLAKIIRAHLDGSNPVDLITNVHAKGLGIDTIHGKIYYSDAYNPNYNFVSANLADGSGQQILYSSPTGSPGAIAVDPVNGYIYFSDWHSSVAKIFKANLDGSNQVAFINNVNSHGIGLYITSTSEALTVSNPSTTGLTVALNPALTGLTSSNFTLLDGSTPVTISSASTSDNGATYTIDAMLTEGKTYTVTAAMTGYTFGTAQNVVVPAAPIITGISPDSGPAAGGGTITINGTNLSVVSAVYFGSTSATSFNLGSDTSLTAVAPAGSGTVDVTVHSLGGTSTTSSSDHFTYIRENPPAPTLSSLTLNGNIPDLTVGEAVYNLNNLNLSGEDQYHNPFSLTGQTIQWNLATGSLFANLTGSTLAPLAAGSGTVTATVYGITSNTLGFNILAAPIPAYDLSLGDSIAYGMSATQGSDYVDLLYNHLLTTTTYSSLSLNNLAVSGDTSSSLLTRLQTAPYIAAVRNAKVITVSIGGDNLLSPVIGAVCTAFGVNSVSNPNLMSDLATAMATNPNKDTILANLVNSPTLAQALQAGVGQFSTDFPQIIGMLKTLSPQAQIYVLNLYNPFNPQDPLYAVFDPLIHGINQGINNNAIAGYKVADVYTKFRTIPGAVNFNLATVQLDPHPTTVGHAAIYQALLDAEAGQIPATYYGVNFGALTGGSITANTTVATSGSAITLIIAPSSGMQLKVGTLKYNDGTIDHYLSGTGFTMPATNVIVTAEFEPIPSAPTLSSLTLNGNIPDLTVGEAVYSLNNLTLSGEDQYHNPFSLIGQTIQWNLATGSLLANLTGSTLTPLAAGSGTVTATVYGITSNTLGFNILAVSIPAPQLLSEATNRAGTRIILTFNKPMADPSGNSGYIAVDVTRSSAAVSESVSQVSLETDSTKLDLSLSQALLAGDTISISYTPGTLAGTDGGMLAAISQRTVTNNAPLVVTTNTVTVSDNQSNLAVTADTIVSAGDNPVTITVPESVTGASLNLSTLLQAPVGGTVTSSSLPALNVNTTVDLTNGGGGTPVNVQVAIPSGTTVSAPADSDWDGTIQVPTIQATNSVTVAKSSGTIATVESVIEVGYGDVPLTFSRAVRILIPGQAGSKVGYVRSGTFYPITNVLSADTQSLADSVLGAGQDGYINVGNDLIIWTKHFTKFITYRETAINTGGNSGSSHGGGGGGTVPVTLSSIAITKPAAKLSYTVGDTLDLGSLVVTGTMSDNSTQVELVTAANVTGFNSSVPATGQVLTITIGGKTTTYAVNIIAASGIPERIGGMNRYDTAVQIAKVYFTAGTDTVILARGDISADALTAVPLARHDNAPLLLTESGQIPAEVLKEIQDLGAKKVILMGGTAAISQNVADSLIANISGITLQRIAGTDRYDTAYQTAKLLGSQGEAVLVSSSDNAYPDALSVSSWAAYHKVPILYVDTNGGNQLPQATAQALKEFNVQKTTLVGGTGVLPQVLESILPDPVRYAGVDRFATNVQVLKTLQPNPVHVFVASGNDFADALAGAVVAGQSNSWLLLTGANGGSVNGLTLDQQNLLQNTKGSILDLHVFGGTAAVPDSTLTEMKNLLGL